MKNFDLIKIIDFYKLNKTQIAPILFPNAKHPSLALDRILAEESCLDTDQVYALAEYIGVPVHELLSPGTWKSQAKKGTITFTLGNFRAVFTNDFYISLYKDTKLLEKFALHCKSISVDEFITLLNKKIKQYEK